MNHDQSRQSEAGETEPEPSSELTARLMSRGSGAVGVVDVHHPQQLRSRTAGWVAARFDLLDHWRMRYGSDEQAPVGGTDLKLASMPMNMGPMNMGPMNMGPMDMGPMSAGQGRGGAASGFQPVMQGGATTSPVTVTSSPTVRVSRSAASNPEAAWESSGRSPSTGQRTEERRPAGPEGAGPQPAGTSVPLLLQRETESSSSSVPSATSAP